MSRADLNILCWEGYNDRSLLDPFEAEFGVNAVGETLLSDFEAAEQIATRDPERWDVVNINNPFARDYLDPRGLVRPLNRERFAPLAAGLLAQPVFEDLRRRCTIGRDGERLLGVCQRFGAFNLVVNTDRISAATAADQGFDLANDPANAQRFGVLSYEDFNVFHVAIGSGLNPFAPVHERGLAAFGETARRWFAAARLVTDDHHVLNRALLDGEIDFYVSGGVYTCSMVRDEGHLNIRSITPDRGPIGGKGGVAFAEVNFMIERPGASPVAEDFLAYICRPEAALTAAFSGGTFNPVMQMGDPAVMRGYTPERLASIQWDTLEEDISKCAPYELAPDYRTLHTELLAARREAGHGG